MKIKKKNTHTREPSFILGRARYAKEKNSQPEFPEPPQDKTQRFESEVVELRFMSSYDDAGLA